MTTCEENSNSCECLVARRHQQLSQNSVLHTEHSKCDMRYPQKVRNLNIVHITYLTRQLPRLNSLRTVIHSLTADLFVYNPGLSLPEHSIIFLLFLPRVISQVLRNTFLHTVESTVAHSLLRFPATRVASDRPRKTLSGPKREDLQNYPPLVRELGFAVCYTEYTSYTLFLSLYLLRPFTTFTNWGLNCVPLLRKR